MPESSRASAMLPGALLTPTLPVRLLCVSSTERMKSSSIAVWAAKTAPAKNAASRKDILVFCMLSGDVSLVPDAPAKPTASPESLRLPGCPSRLALGQQFLDDLAVHHGRTFGTAVVQEGGFQVVETQQVQHRGV